jgi:hypothetical protein
LPKPNVSTPLTMRNQESASALCEKLVPGWGRHAFLGRRLVRHSSTFWTGGRLVGDGSPTPPKIRAKITVEGRGESNDGAQAAARIVVPWRLRRQRCDVQHSMGHDGLPHVSNTTRHSRRSRGLIRCTAESAERSHCGMSMVLALQTVSRSLTRARLTHCL